ncbi:MAG: hypothetical protein N3B18_05850 [Desulfobacterota bacterium]|nr:hypothetical protein [Thermodesulfobacteriota bacterium]
MGEINHQGTSRRNFLKLSGMSLLSLPLVMQAKTVRSSQIERNNYWVGTDDNRYCVHRTVDASSVDSGFIRARINGCWRKFTIREAESIFWEWNFGERIRSFEEKIAGTSVPTAGGPHTPMVATCSFLGNRGDTTFKSNLNNKVIGINVVPRKEYIKEVNDQLYARRNGNMTTKLEYLKELHQQDIWRKDVQAGLEYFTTPDFETHTFLNLMENPQATLCFQGCYNIWASFELRTIAHIVDPRNPNLGDDMRELAKFPIILHGFYHQLSSWEYNIPAVIYYIVEEFDNSATLDKPGQRAV